MPRYTRLVVPGATYFLTLVTHRRAALFEDERARGHLRESIEAVRAIEPFELLDIVLLPDHLHLLMRLPEDDADFSSRVSRIKTTFTRGWLSAGNEDATQSASRDRQGYRGVWQKRFWEHLVRDIADLAHCREYLYFNPVKHGLVRCPHDWPASTFHRAVSRGDLSIEWRCVCTGQPRSPPPNLPGAEMDL